MCLLMAFSEQEVINGQSFMVGYKSFRDNNGLPSSGNQAEYKLDIILPASGKERILTKWQEVGPKLSSIGNGEQYQGVGHKNYKPGFHIFLNKIDADKYIQFPSGRQLITRVLFKDVTGIGFNGNDYYHDIETASRGLCAIADSLYIKREDWDNARNMTTSILKKKEEYPIGTIVKVINCQEGALGAIGKIGRVTNKSFTHGVSSSNLRIEIINNESEIWGIGDKNIVLEIIK